ncbi:MAG TPA: CHAT domain-containing tetratricopeptide repeat protein [Micromonosporaceae bacterium]|nr:CHAT domain-containing tetratricopeptide repeat protein [Micromonosporaceae bacterium]
MSDVDVRLTQLAAMAHALSGAAGHGAAPTRAEALAWYEANWDSLLAMVRGDAGSGSPAGVARAARAGYNLLPYLFTRRDWPTIVEVAGVIVNTTDATGDPHRWLSAQQALGVAQQQLGDRAAAHATFTTIAGSTGGPGVRAQAVAHLGQLAREDYNLPEAARLLGEAIVLYRQAGSVAGEARTLGNLANVRRDLGAVEDAHAASARALELFIQAGDAEGSARALRVVAADHLASGRLAEGLAALREAAGRFAELGIAPDADESYSTLVRVLVQHRRYAGAREAVAPMSAHPTGPDMGRDALSFLIDVSEAADRLLHAPTDQARDEVVTRWPLLLDPSLTPLVRQAWSNLAGAGATGTAPAVPAAAAYLRRRLAGHAEQAVRALWQTLRELAAQDRQALPEQVRRHVASWQAADDGEVRTRELTAGLERVPPGARLVRGWFHRALADEYLATVTGSRSAAVEASIAHGEQALAHLTRDAAPDQWAMAHARLASALRYRLAGDPAANADRAIVHCRHALTVVRRASSPEQWAALMTNLANAYGQASGDRAGNLRRALTRHQAALQVFTEDGYPVQWAQVNTNIGFVLMNEALAGDPANLERAVGHLTRASRVASLPDDLRGAIELNLAYCYMHRGGGDAQDNADAAVRHAQAAYDCYEQLGDTFLMARSAGMLGGALAMPAALPTAGDLERAIEWHERARALVGVDEAPLFWAGTTDDLAGLHLRRSSSTSEEAAASEESWLRAVQLHTEALDTYARYGEPMERARAQYNLAATLTTRGRQEDLDRAAELLERSLDVRGETTVPVQWAESTILLAQVRLSRASDPAGAEPAVRALRRVGDVLGESAPERVEEAWRLLGQAYAAQGRWSQAADALLAAIGNAERTYHATLLRSAKEESLAASAGLAPSAGYALARAGRPADAAVVLERGRVRLVGDRLDRDRVDLAQVRERHPAAFGVFEEAAVRLRALETHQLRPPGPEDAATARDPARDRRLRAQIVDAQAQLEAAIGEIRRLPDATRFLDQPDWHTVTGAVPPGEALAYLVTTEHGSAAVVVPSGGGEPVAIRCPLTMAELLHAFLKLTTVDLATASLAAGPVPADPLEALLDVLGAGLVGPLAQHLGAVGASRVHLVATGLLGALPVHAARFTSGDGTVHLLDRFDVSYAPSARLLASARAAAAAGSTERVLAGVGNPLPNPHPLPFAEQELAYVATLFPAGHRRVRYREAADRPALLAMLPGATYVHFACHGGYDYSDPLASRLELGGGDTMTLADLLSDDVLARARLVVASACESAAIDALRAPDEALGLPTAFLQGGAAAAVGTLWPVPDISCALLMMRFYTLHLLGDPDTAEPPMSIPRALAAAQRWLRTVTADELADLFDRRLTPAGGPAGATGAGASPFTAIAAEQSLRFRLSDPTSRPFAMPHHWAPYLLVGV